MSINIGFTENLKVPLKKEPQVVRRSVVEIKVHSGILKKDCNKEYQCYLSDDLI